MKKVKSKYLENSRWCDEMRIADQAKRRSLKTSGDKETREESESLRTDEVYLVYLKEVERLRPL